MAVDLLAWALDFVDTYGLLAIFVLLVLDGAMLLPVVPGELIMILAVARFAHDLPSLGALVVVATAAGLVGGLFLYGLARGGGRRLIESHPRLFMMSAERRVRMERLFRRPAGQSLVFFLRVIPLTRVLVNIPAGLAKMPGLRFVILSSFGLLLFHAGFFWVAYEFKRPDSAVGAQATIVREAYANPAWAYVQTNWILTAAVILGFAMLVTIRAIGKMARDPDHSSLIGSLTTTLLIWGGLAILGALWIEPNFLYETAEAAKFPLDRIQLGVPYEPLSVVAGVGFLSVLFGWALSSARRSAKNRRPRAVHTVPGRFHNRVMEHEGSEPALPPRREEP